MIESSKPPVAQCEARIPKGKLKLACPGLATHIYGPECEAETGKLMYVCGAHAAVLQDWALAHANDPVECPTHGRIGPVKSYVILQKM